MPISKTDDDGSCSSGISVDSDVAFASIDFTGVDFGNDEPKKQAEAVSSNVGKESQSDRHDFNEEQPKQPGDGSNVKQPIEMPNGQQLQERQVHDPRLFQAQTRRVQNLCKWYELGTRPSLSSSSMLNLAAHQQKDEDLFATDVDDLEKLLLRSIQAQDDMNTNLPPHPRGKYEDSLRVAPSTIEGAGNGLFVTSSIPKGAIVCHYTGYRHHYQSQKRLKDRSYILKLRNGWPEWDRRNDGFVDALPTHDAIARFINDLKIEEKCNVKFEHTEERDIWHCPVVAQRDIAAGEELFISYGPLYWSESRTIGG